MILLGAILFPVLLFTIHLLRNCHAGIIFPFSKSSATYLSILLAPCSEQQKIKNVENHLLSTAKIEN